MKDSNKKHFDKDCNNSFELECVPNFNQMLQKCRCHIQCTLSRLDIQEFQNNILMIY